jgi:hypothetical protein
MALRLRDNLHWCNCEGRAVFLDTRTDRYFCLPQAANDAFLRLAASSTQSGDVERLHMLVQRGMLIEAGPHACIGSPALIEPPTHDFLEEPMQRADPASILRAFASELRAAFALRTKPFHQVVDAVRNARPGTKSIPGNSDRSIQEILSAATAVSFITRSHDRCLVRALAVHSACRSNGSKPKLVFGVIAHPFTAHCWVQLGSAVLVGGYEQARLYTPILVLE